MTGITSNIDDVIERFQGLAKNAKQVDFSEALTVGVNAAMGKMKFRIFNKGHDAFGLDLGKYTGRRESISLKSINKFKKLKIAKDVDFDAGLTDYEKERLKKGRQISYKDLEFTGALRRGIVVVSESNKSVVCMIPNDDLFNISKYQEKMIAELQGSQEPLKIFALSDEEREVLKTNTIEALKQIYVRVFTS